MTIKQLQDQESDLMAQLINNRENQRILNTIEFTQKYGIEIGDTITWLDGRFERKGIVSKMTYWENKPSTVFCNLFNQDGNIGKREIRLWNNDLKVAKVISKVKQDV